MKNLIKATLFVFAATILAACGKEEAGAPPLDENTVPSTENVIDAPAAIKRIIAEIEAEPKRNPPAKVLQYQYNGQTVYYVPSYCCDMYSDLYDENGLLIAHPDGGITGKGDGRCPDFWQKNTNEQLVWEDTRK